MSSVTAKTHELQTLSNIGTLSKTASEINSPYISSMMPLAIPSTSKWMIAITLFTSIGGAVIVHLKKPFQEKSTPIAIKFAALGAALAVSKLVTSVISAANARFAKVNEDINAANDRIEKLNLLARELISLKTLLSLPLNTVAPEKLDAVVGDWLKNSERLAGLVQLLSDPALGSKIDNVTGMMNRSVNLDALRPVLTTLYQLVKMDQKEQAAYVAFKELATRLTTLNQNFEAARADLQKAGTEIDGLKRTITEVRDLLEISHDTSIKDTIEGIKGRLKEVEAKQDASQQLLTFVAGKLSINEELSQDNLGQALEKLAAEIQVERRTVGEAKAAAADTLKQIAIALELAEDSNIDAVQSKIASLMAPKESAEMIGQIAGKLKIQDRGDGLAQRITEALDALEAKVAQAEGEKAEAITAKEKFESIVHALAQLLSKPHEEIVDAVTALKTQAETPKDED